MITQNQRKNFFEAVDVLRELIVSEDFNENERNLIHDAYLMLDFAVTRKFCGDVYSGGEFSADLRQAVKWIADDGAKYAGNVSQMHVFRAEG